MLTVCAQIRMRTATSKSTNPQSSCALLGGKDGVVSRILQETPNAEGTRIKTVSQVESFFSGLGWCFADLCVLVRGSGSDSDFFGASQGMP